MPKLSYWDRVLKHENEDYHHRYALPGINLGLVVARLCSHYNLSVNQLCKVHPLPYASTARMLEGEKTEYKPALRLLKFAVKVGVVTKDELNACAPGYQPRVRRSTEAA